MPPRKAATFSGGSIQIEGLRDFNRALKQVSDQYPKQVKDANYDLAREVATRAKTRAMGEGGSARKAAASLRASRSANASAVSGGGPRYPYFWGAEFGSKRYGQFKAWRGNQWGGWDGGPGYFLHPTIRNDARKLIDDYMKRLDELAAEAFPG